MLMYIFADLEIFNDPDHGHNVVLDAEIKEYKNIGGNDVLLELLRIHQIFRLQATMESKYLR